MSGNPATIAGRKPLYSCPAGRCCGSEIKIMSPTERRRSRIVHFYYSLLNNKTLPLFIAHRTRKGDPFFPPVIGRRVVCKLCFHPHFAFCARRVLFNSAVCLARKCYHFCCNKLAHIRI